jgi:hypothetical protein
MKNAAVFQKVMGNIALIIPERSPFGDLGVIQKNIGIVCNGNALGNELFLIERIGSCGIDYKNQAVFNTK